MNGVPPAGAAEDPPDTEYVEAGLQTRLFSVPEQF
jgi:hypothetical protein